MCNGHRNTLALISSTNRCIFGGFTPLSWVSRGQYVSDVSMQTFVFTLKNPHSLGARIFRQKQEANAIFDYSLNGPTFGHRDGFELCVCDQFYGTRNNYSNLGTLYLNDTGIAGDQVLTGAKLFTLEEIEVFEVV
jgi:hypothetical protein